MRKGKQWENGKRQTDTRDKKTTVQRLEIKPCCPDKQQRGRKKWKDNKHINALRFK